MSLLWIDPLDQYGGDEAAMLQGPWAEVSVTLDNAHVRTGGWALKMRNNTGGQTARRIFKGPKVTAGYATAIFLDSMPATEFRPGGPGGPPTAVWVHQYRDAANNIQVSLCIGTDGSIVAYSSGLYFGSGFGAGTLLGRSVPCLHAGSFDHLESRVVCDTTDGYLEVRVNGVTRLAIPNVNTNPTGTGEVSQIATYLEGGSNSGCNLWWCDLAAVDDAGPDVTDFIGDQKAYYQVPNGDTAQADFTPSTGATSYGVVDETPPNDADYLSLAGTTGKTNLQLTPVADDLVSIAGVMPLLRGFKDDAGVCDLAPGIVQGATYAGGVGQPITTGAQYYEACFTTDPVSGLPFTAGDLDTLQLVLERTA